MIGHLKIIKNIRMKNFINILTKDLIYISPPFKIKLNKLIIKVRFFFCNPYTTINQKLLKENLIKINQDKIKNK